MAEQTTTSETNQAAARARARAIRAAAEASPRLSASEQRRVAENLWGILAEAERQNVSKARVLHAAGQGTEGESTKRLPRFAINPDLPAAEKERRAGGLTKRVTPYLAIAEAAARLLGQGENAFVASLLVGTRFTSTDEGTMASDEDEVAAELAELVRRICSGVARKHGLADLFRTVHSRSLCRHSGALRQTSDDTWSLWRSFSDGALVTGFQDEGYIWSMPYPSVLLGWTKLADLDFRLVRRSRRSSQGEGGSESEDEFEEVSDDQGAPVMVKGKFSAEVRLGILPAGPAGAPEAVFLTRIWTSAETARWSWEYPPLGEEGLPRCTGLKFQIPGFSWMSGLPYRPADVDGTDGYALRLETPPAAWEDGLRRLGWGAPSLHFGDLFMSEASTRIDVVSPAACRRLFDMLEDESPITDALVQRICADPPEEPGPGERYKVLFSEWYTQYWEIKKQETDIDILDEHITTPRGSLAWVLERSIFHERDERLDAVMDQVCATYAKEIGDYLGPIREWRENLKSDLRSKWS
jgi:hypothetical protein